MADASDRPARSGYTPAAPPDDPSAAPNQAIEPDEAGGSLEQLVDSIEAIVWEADPVSRCFTFVSRRAEDLLGYPVERWLKEAGFWESIIHRNDRDRVLRDYRTALDEDDGDYDFEYRLIAADGRPVRVRDLVSVVRDARGRTERLRGVMVDVTERVLAERRARTEHAATRVLAEAATLGEAAPRILEEICLSLGWDAGGLWIVDPAADLLRCHAAWANPAADVAGFLDATRARTFGRGIGLPGRVWSGARPAWIPDVAVDDNFPRGPIAVKHGLHGAFGFPIVLRGAVLGVLEFFSRKIREPDDPLMEMMVTIGSQIGRFVESAEAAEAVRESHARGRAMLTSALDCIISIDHEGRIIEFNPAAERTFGFAREDVIGKDLAEVVVPPADRERHRAGLHRYLASGDGAIIGQRVTMAALRSDGTTFPVELAVAAVESDPPIFTGYLRDISEAKAAERALEESRARLGFLAEASALLSSSLNYRAVLERLAHLVTPWLADWCAVDVLDEDGSLRRVAVAHTDPAKRETARLLQGVRLANGEGGAVREVLTSGEGVIVRDGPEATGANHADDDQRRAVAELGSGTAMVVPLLARGRTLGTITLVATGGGRSFGAAELSLAEDLARRAALAVDNARLYRERSHVARTLQRSLLPPHLPRIPGVDVAARYHAAGEGNEVGGDFYDLFRTGKDDWAILIGDVCGKGADAAALTALARYTVRAAAMQARKPSRVLGLLNDALLSETPGRGEPQDRLCTVSYARLRPTEGGVRITVAAGGHPPPLIVRADGRVEASCGPGTMLGAVAEPRLADRTSELGRGDTLVFYTDGVTEARGPEGVLGDDGLRDLLAGCGSRDAAAVAESIERVVLDFQEGSPRDDIALLVVRVAP